MNAKVLKSHGQIFGRGSRVVRKKKKWSPANAQCLDKFRRSRNQMILPVDHTIHVD